MSKHIMVITDCEHIDYAQEQAVCTANGVEFLKLDLKDEDEAAEKLQGLTAVATQYLKFTDSLFDKLPDLKCVVRYGTGVDNIDLDAAVRHNVAVCNMPDYSMYEVASHAFAMMMALTRKLKVLDRSMSRGEWNYKACMPIYRYSELTVGVVGYGRIGRTFAKMAQGVGCKIAVYDPLFPPSLSQADREKYAIADDISLMALEELLASCNVISLHAPLTKENGGCINNAQLAKMRSDAFLINVSRGGLVNETDLYEALVNGVIAGAACDTWEQEPVPTTNPLLQLDNFIATPHMAWYSEQSSQDLKRKVAEECVRALKGEPLQYQMKLKKS